MNKIIWCFWLQGRSQIPLLQRKCIDSWILNNPEWNLILLERDNVNEYVDINIDNLMQMGATVQAVSDVLRIELLNKYGGVWVDVTCLCVKPLDEWLPFVSRFGFFAFFKPGKDRIISSWFIYSVKEHYLIRVWRDSILKFWHSGNGKPLPVGGNPRIFSRVVFRCRWIWSFRIFRMIVGCYPYFWVHYLFETCYLKDIKFKEIWNSIPKISADIPHYAQSLGLLNTPDEIQLRALKGSFVPLYKLDKNIGDEYYESNSVMGQIMK